MPDRTDDVFDKIAEAKELFASKHALTEHFLPDRRPFRDRETQEIARILAPCLRRHKPSNALVYGNPARSGGWMCECGEKLSFEKDKATCHTCSKQYKKSKTTVERTR